MGRQLLEIQRFDQGIIGNADPKTADPESAGFSVGVDFDAPAGVLRGARGPQTILGGQSLAFNRSAALVSQAESGAILGIDHAAGKAWLVDDYQGSPDLSELGDVAGEAPDYMPIEILNKNAYVGGGRTEPAMAIRRLVPGQRRLGTSLDDESLRVYRASQNAPFVLEMGWSGSGGASTITVAERGDGRTDLSDLPSAGMIQLSTGGYTIYTINYSGISGMSFTGCNWGNAGTPTATVTWEAGMPYNLTWSTVFIARKQQSQFNKFALGSEEDVIRRVGSDGDMPRNQRYVLLYNYTYDRANASPLRLAKGGYIPFYGRPWDAEAFGFHLWVQGFGEGMIPDRVTGINVYLAPASTIGHGAIGSGTELVSGSNFYANAWIDDLSGPPRLAGFADLEPSPDPTEAHGSWAYRWPMESAYVGATFESMSGFYEGVAGSDLRYRCSAQINSQLFVGNVNNIFAPDENWDNYIVRSLPLNFESFNWVTDYVILPSQVTALASFGGRIYGFDEGNAYRINPEALYIEDHYPGISPVNPACVMAIDKGLFVLTRRHLYGFDGRDFAILSDAVREIVDHPDYGLVRLLANAADQGLDGTNDLWMSYDEARYSILVYAKSSQTGPVLWVYSLREGTWSLHEGPAGLFPGVTSHMGAVIATRGGDLITLFTGERGPWEWVTQRLTMGQHSQQKKFRRVTTSGDTPAIEYAIDGAAMAPVAALDTAETSSNGRHLQVRLEGTPAQVVQGLRILYRDKGGYVT